MRHSHVRGFVVAAACLVALAATGCQSTQLQEQIEDQERMIRQLRQDGAAADQRLKAKEAELSQLRRSLESERGRAASYNSDLERLRAANEAAKSEAERELARLREQLGGDASVEMRDGDLVVTLPNRITFGSGSSELSSNGKRVLDKLVRAMNSRYASNRVSVEGHTDSEPIKKSKFKTNWRLSVERAMAVRHFLEKSGGMDANRFRVVGYGPHRPVARNTTESGRQENRRVEIVILADPGAVRS